MTQEERVAALQAACLTAQRVLEAMAPEARARALHRLREAARAQH